MNYENIGKKLKELRIKHKFSQEDVAAKCFVTRQAVSRWENDKSIPDYETLKKIMELYNIDLDYLFYEKEEEKYRNLLTLLKNNIRLKKYKTISIVFFIAILSIFSILFTLLNYNQTRVYDINYTDSNLSCSNGLIVLTPFKTFFKGCSPVLINDEEIDTIEFYYQINSKKKLIYSGGINSTDFIWHDDKMTEELFYNKDIKNKIPIIFAKITTNKNSYEFQLSIQNVYKNSL